MRSIPLVLAALVLLLLAAAAARADAIETFSLDSSTVSGTTKTMSGSKLTVARSLSLDGVSFDALLTVQGSAGLTRTSSGLGVTGGASALLNDNESLTFAMAISNVSGGTVTFGGFTLLDFTFFTTSGEKAIFSLDASLATTGDNFLTHTALSDPDISATAPTAFTLFGKNGTDASGGVVTTSFRVDSIETSFSATATVPEPGTLALCALAAAAALLLRTRRRGRRRIAVAAAGTASRAETSRAEKHAKF